MSFEYVYTYKEFVIVTEAPQYNRMTATGQDTDNKKNTNIQISNVQNSKNTIYNIDNYVQYVQVWYVQIWNVNKYVCWIMYNSIIVPRLLSSVHEMDCLREETVPVSGRSGAQSSVASTRR